MSTPTPPYLLTETGCVRWKAHTLRQLGKDEHFLEAVIGANPKLLGLEDRRTNIHGRYVAFHQRPLTTPLGRRVVPDVIFLTESGHIIVVEVKLAENPELSNRLVIAQVLDYASSLSSCSEAEVIELFGGAPDASFEDLVGDLFPNADRPEELAGLLLERMRTADLHLVIVCDGAPDGLREFVHGVSNQSAVGNFELRVVELVPYMTPGHPGMLLLPAVPIRTEIVSRTALSITYVTGQPKPGVEVTTTSLDEIADAMRRAGSGAVKEVRPELAAVVAAYDAIADTGLVSTGRAPNYRMVKPADWPSGLHYEFLCGNHGVGVELHLESDGVKLLAPRRQRAAQELVQRFPSISWDPKWARKRGRLAIWMPGASPRLIAETMKGFITDTRGVVDAELRPATTTAAQTDSGLATAELARPADS
jgi:hypothetical protein